MSLVVSAAEILASLADEPEPDAWDEPIAPPNQFLRPGEVMRVLGIRAWQLRKLAIGGQLSFITSAGRSRQYERDSVFAYLHRRATGSASGTAHPEAQPASSGLP